MTSRFSTLLLVAAVLSSVLVGATVGVAGAETGLQPRQADLAIEQPEYVSEPVDTRTVNGSTIHIVHGESFDLVPQNFNSSQVVDAGVSTAVGQLNYESEMGQWEFDPQGETGTFKLYWVVTERHAVNNTTQMVQQKFTATIRVEGATEMHHLSSTEYEERQYYAQLGQEVNASMGEIRDRNLAFARDEGTDRQIYQSMLDRYVSTGDPMAAFTGNYTSMWMLSLMTLGGLLFLLTFLGPLVYVLYKRYKERNERQAIQAVEGDLDAKQLDLADRERLEKLANWDWFDVFEDDHIARAFHDHMGETPLDGWMKLNSTLLPSNLIRDRLQAMAQEGYSAVVEREGGDIVDVTLLRPDDERAADGGENPLSDPSEELVDALDWDDPVLREFDLGEADIDVASLDTTMETLDLEELIDCLDIEMRDFDNPEEFGQFLHEFTESVRNHPFTDEQGRPKDIRYLMNCLLKTAGLFGDRHGFPSSQYWEEASEYALENFDLGSQAEAYVDRVQSGGT